jgi:hypothetical protein
VVLWIGPHLATGEGGRWSMQLAGLWSTIDIGDPTQTYSTLPVGLTAPPGDIFDALALALNQRATPLTGATPCAHPFTGMRLRQEVADWLQTPAGRQSEGPRFATGYRWEGNDRAREVCGEPRVVARAKEAPAVAPAKKPPAVVSAKEPPAGAVSPVAPMAQLPPAASLDDILRTLLEGGWCEALDHLLPTVLVRLPRGHSLRQTCLQVHHAGTVTWYGFAGWRERVPVICRQSDQSITRNCCGDPEVRYPPGPDSFLQAVLGASPQCLTSLKFTRVRRALASILACNRTLMQLGLALFQGRFPGDQEILLRMCLIKRRLTRAGEQLMDPSRPQRRVTREDLEQWFKPNRSALLRAPEVLAAAGISVLDAQRLASPLFPTMAGEALLGHKRRTARKGLQPDALTLLKQQLPELIYAYGTREVLHQQIGVSASSFRLWASPSGLREARPIVMDAMAMETLDMPPSAGVSSSSLPAASVVPA